MSDVTTSGKYRAVIIVDSGQRGVNVCTDSGPQSPPQTEQVR